jgi:Fe-S-cluster containining protein
MSPGIEQKKELLNSIYHVYWGWIKHFPLVCRKGCADCCTQSVSMSSLEGMVILDFIEKNSGEEWLRQKLASAVPVKGRASLTMNQFAKACLEQQETGGNSFSGWNFTPCVFLKHDACTIYQVRPFGCRSFGSLVRCSAGKAAEIAPIHLAVNTVFTQIVEHLSSDGGCWSNMALILENLLDKENPGGPESLPAAQPVPGFLLEPREEKTVKSLIQEIAEHASDMGCLGDLIDNLPPIE